MASDSGTTVAVLGAASLVGEPLLRRLAANGATALAYSRQVRAETDTRVSWRLLPTAAPEPADCWISVAPLRVLADYFPLIEASGARRVVQLSSTSQFTKIGSADAGEAEMARRLVADEAAFRAWAEARGIGWTILRPTLIYGPGDHNVSEIARFIRRYGFFPLFGKAEGLRQPVAAEDVAGAAIAAAGSPAAAGRAYAIAGGEVLTYKQMVHRIFASLGKRPVTPSIPLWCFSLAVRGLKTLPRYRDWTTAMAVRMNQDMAFDNADAHRDLDYAPRPFSPGPFP